MVYRIARIKCYAVPLLIVFCMLGRESMIYGQGAAAALTGQVTDVTGAVIPGAALSLIDKAGGQPYNTVSNEAGYYRFSALRPGVYKLAVQKAGFGDVSVPDITLNVNETPSVNIVMKAGKVTTEINVSAATTMVDTQTAQLGGVVSTTQTEQLPLSFRDPTQMVSLVPGVQDLRLGAIQGTYNGISFQWRLDFTINGYGRCEAQAMVDGVDITLPAGSYNTIPFVASPDNTQEFKVLTNDYSAQFGRGIGVVTIITKSGTNHLHGTAYDFLQNNHLNANNLFDNTAGVKLPVSQRNQYGFAVGGPVYIPHAYNGRDKTFWFMDLERMAQSKFTPLPFNLPSTAMEQGDFSNFYGAGGQKITLYNPLDTYVDPTTGRTLRRPFPNNQITSIDPFASKIMNLWPAANNPGILAPNGGFTSLTDYEIGGRSPLDFDRYDIKIDHNISATSRLLWRFSKSIYHNSPVDYIPGHPELTDWAYTVRNEVQNGYNMVASHTWSPSPTMVVTQSLNWARQVDGLIPPPAYDPTQLGGPFTNGAIVNYAKQYAGGTFFPHMIVGNYMTMGNGFGNVFDEVYSSYGYQLAVVKTKGKHTLSAGFTALDLQVASDFLRGYSGEYDYSGQWTCGPDPLNCSGFTGDGLADLQSGLVGNSTGMSAGYVGFEGSKYVAGYFQDDVRLTPKLTVNMGLRYDVTKPFTERYDHYYVFNSTLPNPIGNFTGPNTNGGTINQYLANLGAGPLMGTEQFTNSAGSAGRSIVPTDYTNVSPRLGFAYSATNNLVVRGGFSKAYTMSYVAASVIPAGNGPFSATTPITATINGITPAVTPTNVFPSGFNYPTGSSQGLLSQAGTSGLLANGNAWRNPWQYQWNLGFQYRLPSDSMFSVAYAGVAAHDLACTNFVCVNQIPQSLVQQYGAQVTSSVTNPYYGIITNPTSLLSQPTVQLGNLLAQWGVFPGISPFMPPLQGDTSNPDAMKSFFNSLQVQFQKRMSHGLTLTIAYTWAKILTNTDSEEDGYLGPTVGPQNTVNFAGEWSLSAQDITHHLVIGHVYELPFGRGRRFGSNWPGAVDKVLGQWQFSGMTQWQSGFPIAVSEAGHNTGAFGGGDRPDLIGNPCVTGLSRSQKISTGGLKSSAFQLAAPYSFGDAPRLLPCRQDGMKNADWSLIKFIPIKENVKAELRGEFFNAFNRTELAAPNGTFNSAGFGQVTGILGTPRIIQLGLKINW